MLQNSNMHLFLFAILVKRAETALLSLFLQKFPSHMTVTQQAGRITKKAAAHNNVPQPFPAFILFYNTMNKVPAAMSAQPIRLLAVNGSCRMKNASASVMTTLSLSMGTTLDAAPICKAW